MIRKSDFILFVKYINFYGLKAILNVFKYYVAKLYKPLGVVCMCSILRGGVRQP